MPEQADMHKVKRDILREGAATGVFDGLFPNFVTPYAIALGAGNELIGVINAIPEFASNIFQWFEGRFFERRDGRKDLTRYFALAARLALIPLILIPFFFSSIGIPVLIFSIAFYAFLRGFGSTGWYSWIPELIPCKEWGKFFGDRNMIATAFSFIATMFAGWFLGVVDGQYGFSMLFGLSLLSAIFIFYFLSRVPDIKVNRPHCAMTFKTFVGSLKTYKYFKNFVLYRMGLMFTVYMMGPFIVVYILRDLNIGYEWYAAIVATELLANMLVQPYWGRMADRYGDRTVQVACDILSLTVPLGWVFVQGPLQMIVLAFLSGFAWAGIDLTYVNYLVEVVPPEHKPTYIGNYKMFIGMSVIAGPIVGGILANWTSTQHFMWLTGLPLLFFIAFLLRTVLTIPFLDRFKELRVQPAPLARKVFWQMAAVRPFKGLIHGFEHAPHYVHYYEKKFAKVVK